MYMSDMSSRLNLQETSGILIPDLEINEIHLPMTPEKYEELRIDTQNDQQLRQLQEPVQSGWLEKKSVLQDRLK